MAISGEEKSCYDQEGAGRWEGGFGDYGCSITAGSYVSVYLLHNNLLNCTFIL